MGSLSTDTMLNLLLLLQLALLPVCNLLTVQCVWDESKKERSDGTHGNRGKGQQLTSFKHVPRRVEAETQLKCIRAPNISLSP